MHGAETTLQSADPREESIQALEMDIQGEFQVERSADLSRSLQDPRCSSTLILYFLLVLRVESST